MSSVELILYKKQEAKRIVEKNQIIASQTRSRYFIINDHQTLLETIHKSPIKNFYEHIPPKTPVNLYFDVEIYPSNNHNYFDQPHSIINIIKRTINNLNFLKGYTKKWVILESHNQSKKSFHLIIRLHDSEGVEWYFNSYEDIKNLYKSLKFDQYTSGDKNSKIIDPAVYRDGLFRTIYSSKEGEHRPLVRSELSDEYLDIESFVTFTKHTHTNNLITFDNKLKKDVETDVHNLENQLDTPSILFIKQQIGRIFNLDPNVFLDPFVDNSKNCIIIPSMEKYCYFVKRQHVSNNQYFVIDCYSIKQKCHDHDCSDLKHNETRISTLESQFVDLLKKYLKLNNSDFDRIEKGIIESQQFLRMYDPLAKVVYNPSNNTFISNVSENSVIKISGQCSKCHSVYTICQDGLYLECKICKKRFPTIGYLPNQTSVNFFFTQINITINNNNEDDSLCTNIVLDKSIYNDDDLTMIMSNALHGHKSSILADFFSRITNDFVYDGRIWYYVKDDIWKEDNEGCAINRFIMNILTDQLSKIIRFYKNQPEAEKLLKNIDKLIINVSKPPLQSEIRGACRDLLLKSNFKTTLNSKLYLLPFTNGVYDFNLNKFRAITKEDYISETLSYEYNLEADTTQTWTFINQVLHPHIRDYVLKQISKCLNGELDNTIFHILNGTGSNGKSQLINLIVETLGKYTFKPDISLITTNRTDSASATPQKACLYNKRFAYFAEPNVNDRFNGGLLKELTGSEDIIARNLYEQPFTFRIHSKFFLACNTIPDIEGDDAIWRRIRIIDFKSKFVDNPDPSKPNEFAKDPLLPIKMKQDPTFKQGFMKILLEYYYKDVYGVPDEVIHSTEIYRDANQDFINWCDNRIIIDNNNILTFKDLWNTYTVEERDPTIKKQTFRKKFNAYVSSKYPEHQYKKQCCVNYVREGGWPKLALT